MPIDIIGGVFRDLLFYGSKNEHSSEFLEMPGGSAYNVLLGLQSLNIKAHLHGSVGKDWPFERISDLNVVTSEKSGVFVSLNEKKVLAVYRGANLLTNSFAPSSRILFSTLECGGEVFKRSAENAKKSGKIVIVDPSPIFEWKDEYLQLCDVILPNLEEYDRIFQRFQPPKHMKVFLKLGEKGGIYIKNGERYAVHSKKKGNFPLGCGDAFDVMILYGIYRGMGSKKTLSLAVEAGEKAAFTKGSSSAVTKAIEWIQRKYL